LGIKFGYKERDYLSLMASEFNRIKVILAGDEVKGILKREQFEVLWLLFGMLRSKLYTKAEIADILKITEKEVDNRAREGIERIQGRIIDKILDLIQHRVCAARDCNNVFEPTTNDKIYCSVLCKNRERVRRVRDKKKKGQEIRRTSICSNPNCGIEYEQEGRTKKYCSPTCRSNDQLWHLVTTVRNDPANKHKTGGRIKIRIRKYGDRVLYEKEECPRDIVAAAG
jgi:hypothetical protein